MKLFPVENDPYEYVYVKWFRHRQTGKIIRAEQYGLKAFRLRVRKK